MTLCNFKLRPRFGESLGHCLYFTSLSARADTNGGLSVLQVADCCPGPEHWCEPQGLAGSAWPATSAARAGFFEREQPLLTSMFRSES
jgi:hypothetical protein